MTFSIISCCLSFVNQKQASVNRHRHIFIVYHKLQLPEVMVFMISMNITSLIIKLGRRGFIPVTKHFCKATLVLGFRCSIISMT